METEKLSWVGYEVSTPQVKWICTTGRSSAVGFTSPTTLSVDGIDYFLEFTASDKQSSEIPNIRRLHLRASEHLVGTDLGFLKFAVDGQLLQTSPWDRFIEVYKRD